MADDATLVAFAKGAYAATGICAVKRPRIATTDPSGCRIDEIFVGRHLYRPNYASSRSEELVN